MAVHVTTASVHDFEIIFILFALSFKILDR